jgi:hypothetical protein
MFTSGAPVSDNTGSKCKIICRIKISAIAGRRGNLDFKLVQYQQVKVKFGQD